MAKQKVDKTNAMRLLETRAVAYEPLVYDAGIHSAEEVARVLEVPPEQVYTRAANILRSLDSRAARLFVH